ncbi:ribosome silencing factor [Fulvivirga sedimenti]|uniref:Ribosomal silencing factor RsfS n=1 Tax=Fulvivirga sedimenti TaxID=2879465 RepID=A0A9X1KYJ1_9BACT|nr:ribosome silencing factor [Fulvivirga sedimenti]MCA6077973.1 ribosome silencing factor [Fulvivirga sedimenti]
MGKKNNPAPSEILSDIVVKGMQEKKASNITVMDLRQVKNAVADFFVICSGNSDTQLDAIAESVDNEVSKQLAQNPWHREGTQNKEWVLLDYVDVVAHIFKPDKRKFFGLENMWGDATIHQIEDVA